MNRPSYLRLNLVAGAVIVAVMGLVKLGLMAWEWVSAGVSIYTSGWSFQESRSPTVTTGR